MMEQHRSSFPKKQDPYSGSSKSNLTVKNKDQTKNGPAGNVDIIAMVRSLQRTAGMADCFRQGNRDCDIIDCDWRIYCLGNSADPRKNRKPTRLK